MDVGVALVRVLVLEVVECAEDNDSCFEGDLEEGEEDDGEYASAVGRDGDGDYVHEDGAENHEEELSAERCTPREEVRRGLR